VPERKVWFWVGWVEPPSIAVGFSADGPTYDNQALAKARFQRAKPNSSYYSAFVQRLIKPINNFKNSIWLWHLKGGDKPRHYGRTSTKKVAAGFIPARMGLMMPETP